MTDGTSVTPSSTSCTPNTMPEKSSVHLHFTEFKSKGTLSRYAAAVRVFVDKDYHYGYFVDEHKVFELLTPEQQAAYLAGDEAKLDVAPAVAQKIVSLGRGW